MRRFRDTLYKGFCYKNSKKDAPFSGDQNIEKKGLFLKKFVHFWHFLPFFDPKSRFFDKKDAPFSLKYVKNRVKKSVNFCLRNAFFDIETMNSLHFQVL